MLGITPATLRRWADRGDVAAFITPGGHRRFRRNAIEALIPTPRSARAFAASIGGSAARVANAYRRAKHGRPANHDDSLLSDADLAEFRDRGRRLLALLLDYLDGREPARLREATGAAGDYGRRAAELRLSLSDTVEAFVRFRRAFTGELAVVARRRRLDTHDATALIVEAERVVDQLLIALTDGHAAGRA
jgi:Helix-turn-helix domain